MLAVVRRLPRGARIVAAAVAVLVLVAAALGAWYVARAYLTKTRGVELHASVEVAPGDVVVFLQSDPEWADEAMGGTRFRMGGSGCLVSCIASALCAMGVETDPGQVNAAFTAAGVYDAEANVVWKHIGRAFPGVGYRYTRVFDGRRIEADLRAGLRPLLGVRYLGGGAQHWVEVVGSHDGDFLVMDPLARERKPIPLSRHGRVFYYRVLVRTT